MDDSATLLSPQSRESPAGNHAGTSPRRLQHVMSYDTLDTNVKDNSIRRRPSLQQLSESLAASPKASPEERPQPIVEFPATLDIEKPIVYVNTPSTPTIGITSPLNWRQQERANDYSSPSADRALPKKGSEPSLLMENHFQLQSSRTQGTPTSAANQLREMERVAHNDSVRGGLVGVSTDEAGASEVQEEDSIEEESAPFPPQDESMSVGGTSMGNVTQDYPQPMMIDTREYSQPSSNASSACTPNGSSNPSTVHSGFFNQSGSTSDPMMGRKTPRTPGTRRSTPVASSAIAEFDPLVPIPTDWMMRCVFSSLFRGFSTKPPKAGSLIPVDFSQL